MGEETIIVSLVVKHSCRTKVEMVVVKVEKVVAKETCVAKLDSVKQLPKTPKGEKEKTYGRSKSGSTNGKASIEKESSKGEASKDNLHVMEQV
jgi:hypothetical protein